MLDLFSISTGDDPAVEHADWVEMQALRKADGSISHEDLVSAINRPNGKNDNSSREMADQAFDELADRLSILGSADMPPFAHYPFELADNGKVLHIKGSLGTRKRRGLVYLLLLTITRHSMASGERTRNGINPTILFEELCGDILWNFWGRHPHRTGFLHLGTSRHAKGKQAKAFKTQMSELCDSLGEGGGWKEKAISPKGGDGGLDISVWRKFADRREGALVGFAQCKTGINWRNDLGKLKPRAFCQKYMAQPLLIDPIPIWMIPCRITNAQWQGHTATVSGILFDRCRIVEYGDYISDVILADASKWLSDALTHAGISRYAT